MEIDFTKLGIEKAFSNLFKKDFTNKEKEYLREHLTIIGNNYCIIKRSKQPAKTGYSPDDQAKIDKFIMENGIKEIELEPAKENYKIELVATPLAEKEAQRIIENAMKNSSKRTQKNIKRLVSNRVK